MKEKKFIKAPRVRELVTCDMCGVGTGTSEQYDPMKREWEKIIHSEKKIYEWRGGEIVRMELQEYGSKKEGYRHSPGKVVYNPKKMCGTCYRKYRYIERRKLRKGGEVSAVSNK